jgi:hypothetical protein
MGTNTLIGADPARIADVPGLLEEAGARETMVPPLWDGKASERIVDVLALTGDRVEELGKTLR